MRIGELSSRTGVSRRSLRYYEEQGLLTSSRAVSGQRHYDDGHVRRVGLIQAFLSAGLSSRAIAQMVPCMDEPTKRKAQRAHVAMQRERNRLSTTIESLVAAQQALDDLIAVNRSYLAE
ncbi:MerR family transcriptional regulator [Jidongwangia harbinensis]|uniref:MerR family transcriptional regulator n=1 Tax=Jidongwangia harbinensis TaxID=2878561 RepID=UPI001CDA39FA|nr:MerR family transcriptional regulator [Jidongwangia harbinensis]MCA2217512.1 MerR family transcriptional regulator [Jidongwangia harbinensis]